MNHGSPRSEKTDLCPRRDSSGAGMENTQRLHDVLQAKGYPLEYGETLAGHRWSN